MSQKQSSHTDITPYKAKKKTSVQTNSPMLTNDKSASNGYRLYTENAHIKIRMTMMMFAAPLYINKDDELTIANGYVDHNFQTGVDRLRLKSPTPCMTTR